MSTAVDQGKQESLSRPCGFSPERVDLTGERENTTGDDMSNEHEHDLAASAVLGRFHNCIERVSWLMVRTYEPDLEYEDAKAEASILVCVYAGIMPGRHSDTLDGIEHDAEGDEDRVQAIMAERLRRNLVEHFAREIRKRIPALDVDNIPPRLVHDDADFESRTISQMLLHNEMRERYPYLCRKYLDEERECEMAEADGTPLRTVEYRIAVERKKALTDPDVFNIVIPEVTARVPLYATIKDEDHVPSGRQIWAWHCAGLCVECGAFLNPERRVRETCSLECWNYARGRRTAAERAVWDYVYGYRAPKGGHPTEPEDPRQELPELYAYEGWASWAPSEFDTQDEMDIAA